MFVLQLLCNALLLVRVARFVGSAEVAGSETRSHTSYISDEYSTAELPKPIVHMAPRKGRTPFEPEFHEISVHASTDANLKRAGSRHQWTPRPTLMDVALQASAREGLDAVIELYGKIMPQIVKNGQVLADNHPAALLSKFSAPADDSERREMAGFAAISATRAFRKNYKHFTDLARQAHTPKISLRRTALEGLCPARDPPTCPAASGRYRTHDGTCNSRRHPRWGSAQMPFNRFLPPQYDDGVDSIRNSVEGGSLSSSRFVSLLVHGAKDGEAPLTLMLAMWGQLLDHDVTSTAQPRSINGSVPSCCGRKDFHPSCFPIKVPLDDPWLAPLKVRCLEFLRSAPAQRRDCVLSWREQTNQATSYIDASPIYSNSAKSSDNARVFRNGLLVFGRGNPAEDVCQRGAIATQCIRAGDGRSGEQPGLLALHHVWVGEHNRIALELSEMNLHWSDEKLYQETRRIIGALFQHITYREFLPIILGREVCKLFDLELLSTGYYEGYNPKVNPTVANSFAAAAFRFGHSLVQNSFVRCDRNHNIITNNVSLHEEFQRGDIGSAGSLHRLIRGLATQRALKRDEFITPELTNHLFQTPGFPFGLDLAAINIQRGRDHGIPSYTTWRIPCGLTPITDWDDLANVVGSESAQRIGHAYRSVHDIDLFVGGIAERPVVGGLVGPTFACIIAQQFSNSRKGDRFWYENGAFESSFTPAQLHSIRRVSLAQVLCRSVGGGTFQPHIFIPAEFSGNERAPCGIDALASIDLTPWLEQDPFAAPPPAQPSMESQLPERIFDIIPTTDIDTDIFNSVQIIKENKAGFSNRIQSVGNMSLNSPQLHVSTIDFIPHSQSGFRTTTDGTNINDKLDIRRKRPTSLRKPTQQPISGIHNKLDKGPKKTSNVKSVNQHHIKTTTTRRTVIVNNIPIELRSANTETATKETNSSAKTDGPEPRAEDEEHIKHTNDSLLTTTECCSHSNSESAESPNNKTLTDRLISQILSINAKSNAVSPNKSDSAIPITEMSDPNVRKVQSESSTDSLLHTNLTHTLFEDGTRTIENHSISSIDPMTHSTGVDHKRVQRQTIPLNFTNDFSTRAAKATKASNKHRTAPLTKPTLSQANTTTITPVRKPPKISKTPKTTERNVELRQYQGRPIYTRPQKVIVEGPNANQYEIEINIRQSNKVPSSRPITNYPEYTTVYKPHTYGYDTYSPHYVNIASAAPPAYGYYQSPPTTPYTSLQQTKRTKPPTIIYLNEHDDRTTTKQPSLFQNIITFATNGIGGNHKPIHPYSTQKEKPPLESGTQIDLLHSPHSSNLPALQYASRPQTHFPVSSSSFSQVGGYVGTGTVHASSSAVSSGNYGSIVGVASANGADSTFSFNIRPKPSVSPGHHDGHYDSSKPTPNSYGLLPPRKSPYTQIPSPEFVNVPPFSPHSEPHYNIPNRESANSPFSTAPGRPQSQNYYSKTHIGPQQTKTSNSNLQHNTFRPDTHDYDYMSRTFAALTNLTDAEDDIDVPNDYDYDDISAENGNDGLVPLSKKYDKDGYLRPEHMVDNLFKEQQHPDTNATLHRNETTALDDNYVLPVLNHSQSTLTGIPLSSAEVADLLNLTESDANFPDSLGKNSNNDILADDYNDDLLEPFIISKTAALTTMKDRRNQEHTRPPTIAFAPIKVLTNPERPDNWVIFDSPQEKPLLPEPPEIKPDSFATAEFPMPLWSLWSLSNIALENFKSIRAQMSEKRSAANINVNDETLLDYTDESRRTGITETDLTKDQLEPATTALISDSTESTNLHTKTLVDPDSDMDRIAETHKRTEDTTDIKEY